MIALLVLGCQSWACGASPPPMELVAARSKYDEAEESRARQLAPARLLEARQALEEAEHEFDENGDGRWARVLAYVAQRKAQTVMAMAEWFVEKQRHKQAQLDYEKELEQAQQRTKSNLGVARKQLSKMQTELQHHEQLLRNKQAELADDGRSKNTKDSDIDIEMALSSLWGVGTVQRSGSDVVILLEANSLFGSRQSRIVPRAQDKLLLVAEVLRQTSSARVIRVEAHTDSSGSSVANERLSSEQAQAVRSFLLENGVAPDKVFAEGKGEDEPVASNRTSAGRARNRRVEIIFGR